MTIDGWKALFLSPSSYFLIATSYSLLLCFAAKIGKIMLFYNDSLHNYHADNHHPSLASLCRKIITNGVSVVALFATNLSFGLKFAHFMLFANLSTISPNLVLSIFYAIRCRSFQ